MTKNDEDEVVAYGEPGIVSADANMPTWLKCSNVFWVFMGFLWLFLFWNGSYGWFDRGYWNELQKAANTTFPIINQNEVQNVESSNPQTN